MILGGVNNSVGNLDAVADRQTLKGSSMRAAFKGRLNMLPPEFQAFAESLLDAVVFRDEVAAAVAAAEGPSFGKITVTGVGTIEATVANDTAIFVASESGSSDHLSLTPTVATKTLTWLLYRAS